ncbi:hypothetical protein GYA49_04880 [Candidatus Beckwithbacteria bacterium]|nr:hypothetical protein [Candidatus Beckwithbacteria bacterium]
MSQAKESDALSSLDFWTDVNPSSAGQTPDWYIEARRTQDLQDAQQTSDAS